MNKVLIVVDSYAREYLGAKLLQLELQDVGFKSGLCSRLSFVPSYNSFKPDVVVVPKTHKTRCLDIAHESAVIVMAQAESFAGSEGAFVGLEHHTRRDLVDLCCCWGAVDYNVYKKHSFYPESKLHITGHMMTDPWYIASSPRKKDGPMVIGLPSSLRAFTHRSLGRKVNPLHSIVNIERAGDSGYFEPPNHAESWIAFEAAWIRIMYQVILELKDHPILLRPHPLENARFYKFFSQFDNVSIDYSGNIVNWLGKVDAVLTAYSQSQIDAHMRGVRVVSLRNLFPSYVIEHLHSSIPAIPYEECFNGPDEITKLKDFLFEEHNDISALDRIGREVYNFPASTRPSCAIAKLLAERVSELKKFKKPFKALPEGPKASLLGRIPFYSDFKMLVEDVRSVLSGRGDMGVTYLRHRFVRNRSNEKMAQAIRNSN